MFERSKNNSSVDPSFSAFYKSFSGIWQIMFTIGEIAFFICKFYASILADYIHTVCYNISSIFPALGSNYFSDKLWILNLHSKEGDRRARPKPRQNYSNKRVLFQKWCRTVEMFPNSSWFPASNKNNALNNLKRLDSRQVQRLHEHSHFAYFFIFRAELT